MILEEIIAHAREKPDSVAIVDDKRTLTYQHLVWGGHVMAGHIDALAEAAGGTDRIGLLIPQSSAFAVALMGTRWTGRIGVPLNYLLKPAELLYVVQDADLKVVLTIKHFQPLADALTAAGIKVVCVEDLAFEPPTLGQKMMAAAKSPANPMAALLRAVPPRVPDDTAVILYTSGTSGVPKGVELTNENLESNARNATAHAHFTERTIFLGVLPCFHSLGLMGTCLIPLMLGSKVVYQARFSPAPVLQLIQEHKVEVIIAVPTMYAVLLNAKSGTREHMASVKIVVSGGEALPVPLIEGFHEKFGSTIMEGFGLTETSPIVALSMPWAHKPGSVGKLIPQTQVRIVDEVRGDLPPGQDGELYLKGPNIMKGYYKKPDETAAVFAPDRWFKTGDLARMDEDGFLYITGRIKDMIIMAGEKIFPREIEEVLKRHPAVLLAAVVGVKDESRGECPVAFIQLKPDAAQKPTSQELRTFVRDQLAPYKTPREVYFMDEMPMTPTGKVLKRALKVPAE